MKGTSALPFRSWEYMQAIKEVRERRGIRRGEAAERAGMAPETWSKLEGGYSNSATNPPRPQFDTVASMADAVGLRLVFVPDRTRAILPDDMPTPVHTERVRKVSPVVSRLVEKIRAARKASGLSRLQAATRASLAESTWKDLENGVHPVGRDFGVDRLQAAASALGMELELTARHHRPFLRLDERDATELRRLVAWYCARAPRIPEGIARVRDRLDGTYREPTMEETAA